MVTDLTFLHVFREDGKDSMKFYTDPTYFVELWVQEMDKQIQENKTELNKKREKRKVSLVVKLFIYKELSCDTDICNKAAKKVGRAIMTSDC